MNRSKERNESYGGVVSTFDSPGGWEYSQPQTSQARLHTETNAGPSPWMTVKLAAAYAGCHEETIRRGYLSGHLKATPFGIRGRRIHISDLEAWMQNGARTR